MFDIPAALVENKKLQTEKVHRYSQCRMADNGDHRRGGAAPYSLSIEYDAILL